MASLRGPVRWRSERGAELIEFALVLPLLLLVVLGILDCGLLFQRYQVVTNATREGARVAILPGYGAPDVAARVRQYLQASGLDAVPTIGDPVAIARDVNGKCISLMSVTVSYPHQYLFLGGIIRYFGGDLALNALTATSAMRTEGPSGACS